jgi:hypothetical protein
LLPALIAACLVIPLGLGLYILAGGDTATAVPPISSLLGVTPGTLIVVAVLTAVPARIGARRSVAEARAAEWVRCPRVEPPRGGSTASLLLGRNARVGPPVREAPRLVARRTYLRGADSRASAAAVASSAG